MSRDNSLMITKRKLLLLFALLIATGITFAPFIYGAYIAINYRIAELTNLHVKYRINDDLVISEIVPENADGLFLCGTISSGWSNYLVITLLSADEKLYYGKDRENSPYTPGDFCAEIKITRPLAPGKYKIIVIDSHKRVGELIFQVR